MIKYLVACLCSIAAVVLGFKLQDQEPELNNYSIVMGVILTLSFMAVVSKIDDWWTAKYSYLLSINYVQARIISKMLYQYISPLVTQKDKDKKVLAVLVDWDEKEQDALVVFSSENCDSYVPLKEISETNIVRAIGDLEDQEWHLKTNKTQRKWDE
jgi:hypothetical protein